MNPSRYIRIIFLLAAIVAVSCSVSAESHLPASILVVKESQDSFVRSESIEEMLKSGNIDLKIYDIDAVDRFESEINQLLPGDESKARQIFNEYVNRVGRKAFEQDAIKAYRGVMIAVRYNLEKYPAIVFDGNSVIYGVLDLDDALHRYDLWKTDQAKTQ